MSEALEEAEKPGTFRDTLKHKGYAAFLLAKFLANFAVQMLVVAVAWQIYDITRDPVHLGLVGLVEFLPPLLLVTFTGAASDRFSRRNVMLFCLAGEALATGILLALTLLDLREVLPIYGALVLLAIARAFFAPAQQAIVTNLVPRRDLASAIAANSAIWQLSSILGPLAGGLLYGISAEVAQTSALVMTLVGLAATFAIPRLAPSAADEPASWARVLAGFRFIWQQKIVLGAVSLDLFIVLLGGATALLPVFARDILEVGPWGLGMLRAAPGIGALLMAIWLGWRPLKDHAGLAMFVAVGLFGVAHVVFGWSDIVWLSALALAATGATDMISVYVRETLIQLNTPNALRGRVGAVNFVFIGASNELGAFRAGMMAGWLGAVPAVVLGGFGAVFIAFAWAYLFPELRKARQLKAPDQTT